MSTEKRKYRKPRKTKYFSQLNYGKIQFNKEGLKLINEWASDGCSISEIAQFFGFSKNTLQQKMKPDSTHEHHKFDPELYEAYNDGRRDYLLHLRRSQKDLAGTSAQMAIHLGKHELEQTDKPVQHEHTHKVVGTLPDYNATPEAWRRQFAPSGVQAITDSSIVDVEPVAVEVRDELFDEED